MRLHIIPIRSDSSSDVLKSIVRRLASSRTGSGALPETGVAVQVARLVEAGKADEAHALCAKILEVEPTNAEALQSICDIALQRNEFGDGIRLLRAAIALNSSDASLRYKLGYMLEDAGALEEAVESYEAALRLNPSAARTHCNMGSALQKMGQMERALLCFERALALDADLWQAHYNIGNFHKLQGHLETAIVPFQEAMRLRRTPGNADPALSPLFSHTSRGKLLHDIDQLRHLIDRGLISDRYQAAVSALNRAVVQLEPEFQRAPIVPFPLSLQADAAPIYNRLLNFYNAPALPHHAVNPRLDARAIQADYFRNHPGITYIDDFLVPEALASLRKFCVESTFWFDFHYAQGYVGSNLEDGFVCPLLAQIASELPHALPGIFSEPFPLTHLWGYKYDSARSGIREHADFAAINVNFWLTPDDANLEPGSGGLVVWDKEAPPDWDFDAYNRDNDRIQRFLRESHALPTVVPYRENRVVIFNSDLLHKTDSYRFRPGYVNRRLNVTFLYGYRQKSDSPLLP
jgi:tetratricopeptide (TPR) repeat protein